MKLYVYRILEYSFFKKIICSFTFRIFVLALVFEEDFDKANAFNEYFHSVFTQSSFTLPDINDLPSISDSLLDLTFTLEEVYQALISLQPNKASGPDNIGPRILKTVLLL